MGSCLNTYYGLLVRANECCVELAWLTWFMLTNWRARAPSTCATWGRGSIANILAETSGSTANRPTWRKRVVWQWVMQVDPWYSIIFKNFWFSRGSENTRHLTHIFSRNWHRELLQQLPFDQEFDLQTSWWPPLVQRPRHRAPATLLQVSARNPKTYIEDLLDHGSCTWKEIILKVWRFQGR